MRQVEKERSVAVGLDHAHGFVRVVVREVAARFELPAAVELRGIAHGRPHHLVDGAELQRRVHDLFRIRRQIQAARHVQAVVEALALGPRIAFATEMPLADVRRLVAGNLHRFRQRDFVRGHSASGDVRHLAGEVVVNHGRERLRVGLLHPVHDRHADAVEGRELEAEARGVAPGHQGGARRCADRIGGVAVAERHAAGGDGVDVRRGRRSAWQRRAAVQGDVVEAKVVGKDEHDVGWSLLRRNRGFRRPLMPSDWPMRRNRIADVGGHRRDRQQEIQSIGVG